MCHGLQPLEDAEQPAAAQQSPLGGLLSLWTFYNTGPAEQIVRPREPRQTDDSADGIFLQVNTLRAHDKSVFPRKFVCQRAVHNFGFLVFPDW